jgi:hypothetical protein
MLDRTAAQESTRHVADSKANAATQTSDGTRGGSLASLIPYSADEASANGAHCSG